MVCIEFPSSAEASWCRREAGEEEKESGFYLAITAILISIWPVLLFLLGYPGEPLGRREVLNAFVF